MKETNLRVQLSAVEARQLDRLKLHYKMSSRTEVVKALMKRAIIHLDTNK